MSSGPPSLTRQASHCLSRDDPKARRRESTLVAAVGVGELVPGRPSALPGRRSLGRLEQNDLSRGACLVLRPREGEVVIGCAGVLAPSGA